MADEVFWDTSGFFALLNTDDPQHDAAKILAATQIAAGRGSVTTDGVIGECCTLLIARRKAHLVEKFLDRVNGGCGLRIVHLDAATIAETQAFLRRHLDHTYSFVDCASFVIMHRFRLQEAATTDGHFTEAGFVARLR